MTSQLGLYRAATRLYPRGFRDQYRDDMVVIADLQLQDGPRAIIAARLIRDLAISIPTQHLENLMPRPSALLLPTLAASVGAVALATGALLGTAASVPLFVVAVAAVTIAGWSYSVAHVVRERSLSRHWWQLLLAGAVLLGAVMSGQAITDNHDWIPWIVLVIAVIAGWLMVAAGVILGALHIARGRHGGHRAVL
jgi:hypothetical protein